MATYKEIWVVRQHMTLDQYGSGLEADDSIRVLVLAEMTRGVSWSLLSRQLESSGALVVEDMAILGTYWRGVWGVIEPLLMRKCSIRLLKEGLTLAHRRSETVEWLRAIADLEARTARKREQAVSRANASGKTPALNPDVKMLKAIRKDLDEGLLKKGEVAKKYGISRPTLRAWEVKGKLDVM